ncbi:MAG TPA: MAPEG family protein, partial [Candidatus Binatia bacterium]|nr:MAPEG family protein [Candidatus Binatia bacterium]
MTTAIVCTALLGLLVFGLGLSVSLTRGQTGTNFGYSPDPTDRMYKMVRAHGNATEYVPMLAVLMLLVGGHNPA